MYVKFLNEETKKYLDGYGVSKKIISLVCPNQEENLNGFILYDDDGNTVKDCSDFVYRWDVLENDQSKIYYTNDPNYKQKIKFSDMKFEEPKTSEEELNKIQLRSDVDYLLMLNE